ncbi:MAG TPA: FAD:protein FMN transferase [Lacipirellulaceae bacterium]|jgi:thiamine biosynthesis lipoprotein|nr:FAD:protein FMN transferase [Lacipirellulaceae bacterium]
MFMTTDRSTRRSFLQGKSIARELSGHVHRIDEPVAIAAKQSFVVSVRRRAMACEFEVQLAAARDDDSMHHVFEALDLVEALESQLTIYRDDSEVSRINQIANAERVVVEPRLFGLIDFAQRIYDDTEGALDITSGPLSEVWGFSRREGRVPSDEQIEEARERVGMQHVDLDATTHTVAFRRPRMSINFNSVGKGYALDRMAELLAAHDIDDILLQGGKSSVLARGIQPGSDASGWRVGVRHPLRNSERLAEIVLHNQALSTSGAGTQFFIRRGKRYGHILDPRSGRPAEGLYSTTVRAPSATEAEALSTAFYVMGPQKAAEYCAAHPEIAALLIVPSNREGDVRLIALGPDDNQWLRLADH